VGPRGTAATNKPIVPAPGDYDNGEIGGIMIGKGIRSTRRKPAPMLLYPPQIPHAARTRTRAKFNWVHSALRQLISLLCQLRVIMIMEKLVE
jgi:hypothetical protein